MNIDEERNDFEAWVAKNGYSVEFYKDSWGYRHDDTEDRWQGWLARAQVERGVSVESLESFLDAMEVSMVVPTANGTPEWEDGYRNGVNIACDELRLLIAEANPPKATNPVKTMQERWGHPGAWVGDTPQPKEDGE